jgi:hypothetical protein
MYREKKTRLTSGRKLTAAYRLLPHFIVISVERGGTTSLYRYLNRHPCVAEPFRKEVDYFDFNWSRGLRWYRAHFPTRWHAAWTRARRGHPLVTGEATPYYLYHPLVPERIVRTLPDVKLIALLRNPVERAYSHYNMNCRQQKESLSFEEAIECEEERLRGEYARLEQGEIEFSENHYKFGYLFRGIYVDRLKLWHEYFPPERLLVLRSEDLYEDPPAVLDQVIDFLGLPSWKLTEFKAYNQKPYQPIRPETRRRLAEHFAPHNERLYEYLGRDFGWS